MIFLFPKHREEESKRLVYDTAKAEAHIDLASGEKEAEITLPEVQYTPSQSLDTVWAPIEEKYGKSAYENLITDYVDGLMKKDPGSYKDALIGGSIERYMEFYERIRAIFMRKAEVAKIDFDYSVDHIKKQTRSELAVLKSGVEGARQLAEVSDTIPSPENKGAVRSYFSDYLEALNARYLNLDVNEGVVVPGGLPLISPFLHPDSKVLDPKAHPKEHVEVPLLGIFIGSDVFKGAGKKGYRNLSAKFAKNMEAWMERKLEFLLKKEDVKQSDLASFRDEIKGRYELYSSIDGRSDIISIRDLAFLEAAARPTPDLLKRIMEDRSDKGIKRLEVMQLMNPEGWQQAVRVMGYAFVSSVTDAGSEQKFVETMKQYDAEIEDFNDAEAAFNERLAERAGVGVPETVTFFREMTQEAHAEILQYSRSIKPPSLSLQVYKQLDYLRSGVLVPEKDGDRMLVRFMNSDREGRNGLLAHPGSRRILLRAIKQATEQYPQIYEKQFSNIPDDPSKLRRSKRIERPTHHDRAAQLQALIILGNEATVIVSQLNASEEHKREDYMAEIDGIQLPEDIRSVRTGLRFKSASRRPGRYRSRLERGGFNARDLALHGIQALGALTVVSNFAQSYSQASGDDFLDKLFNTVEIAATNQGVWTGVAMTAGAYVTKRDPAWLKYPWLSQYQRDERMARVHLEFLTNRFGSNNVNKLLHNEHEWRAMKKLEGQQDKVKELLKKANERCKGTRGKPILTVADIESVVSDKSIVVNLNRGTRAARVRFEFFSKFMGGKPDVNHIKELCTGSSDIAEPYTPKTDTA